MVPLSSLPWACLWPYGGHCLPAGLLPRYKTIGPKDPSLLPRYKSIRWGRGEERFK